MRFTLEAALSAETGMHRQPASRITQASRVKKRFKQIPPFIIFYQGILSRKPGKCKQGKKIPNRYGFCFLKIQN
jgi:hypothetical protein